MVHDKEKRSKTQKYVRNGSKGFFFIDLHNSFFVPFFAIVRLESCSYVCRLSFTFPRKNVFSRYALSQSHQGQMETGEKQKQNKNHVLGVERNLEQKRVTEYGRNRKKKPNI